MSSAVVTTSPRRSRGARRMLPASQPTTYQPPPVAAAWMRATVAALNCAVRSVTRLLSAVTRFACDGALAPGMSEPCAKAPLPSVTPPGLAAVGKNVRTNEVGTSIGRSEEHTSELQSPDHLLSRLLLEKKQQ